MMISTKIITIPIIHHGRIARKTTWNSKNAPIVCATILSHLGRVSFSMSGSGHTSQNSGISQESEESHSSGQMQGSMHFPSSKSVVSQYSLVTQPESISGSQYMYSGTQSDSDGSQPNGHSSSSSSAYLSKMAWRSSFSGNCITSGIS